MRSKQYFKNKIFDVANTGHFEDLTLELFRFQASANPVYGQYLELRGVAPQKVSAISDIPYLPVSLFKSQKVISGNFEPQEVFTSSGTAGAASSRQYVGDISVYEASFKKAFELFYGPVEEYCILALLPSYLDRKGSSLIYMAQRMIEASTDSDSSFYLDDLEKLHSVVQRKIAGDKKCVVLGVSFALLDFAERFQLPSNKLIFMETGGMKGRRKEMIREELHHKLCERLGVAHIHSEYGMTELLSQAYSRGGGRFSSPPWMKISIRETDDPFTMARPGKTGGINIIDLANIDSCAFVETQDLGRIYPDASFEVLGRFDNADIRGCNLMVI